MKRRVQPPKKGKDGYWRIGYKIHMKCRDCGAKLIKDEEDILAD